MYPFKKRKFFNQTSSSTSDRGSQCQGTFDSSDTTRVNDTNHGTGATVFGFLPFIFRCNVCFLLGFHSTLVKWSKLITCSNWRIIL